MKKKETLQPVTAAEVRAQLISKGILKARNEAEVEKVKCAGCTREFERLVSKRGDQYCGYRH